MKTRSLAPLVIVASLLVPSAARAEGAAEVAMAEGLFNQGVKLLEQKKYAEACDMLERSRKLAVGLGVTLYLADCQENNGHPAASLALFREAEKLAAARKDARQSVAHERAEKLEKVVPRVTLRASPAVLAAGQQVILDGRKLDAKELGTPLVLEPGSHKVRSMSEDGTAWESEITVVAGGTTAMDIPLLKPSRGGPAPTAVPAIVTPPPPPAVAPSPAAAPDTPPPARDPGGTQRVIGLVVAGVGVVGLGVGTVFGLSAKGKQSDADPHCNAQDKCDPTGLALRQDGLHAATLSTVFFVVGAAAVAGGAVLYLTAPKGERKTGLALAPQVGAHEAGLSFAGRF